MTEYKDDGEVCDLGPTSDGAEVKDEGAVRFRKRPVVIEAVQFCGDYPLSAALPDWWNVACNKGTVALNHGDEFNYLTIITLEGIMRADPGDWIIRGVKGELYPCKPDIFALTYEPAASPPTGRTLTEAEHREMLASLIERVMPDTAKRIRRHIAGTDVLSVRLALAYGLAVERRVMGDVGAGDEVRIVPKPGVPDVELGGMKCVLAYCKHTGGRESVLPAYYLHGYPLSYEDCVCDSDKEHSDDGCPTTGWFYDESNFEYDHLYHVIEGEVLGWAELPEKTAFAEALRLLDSKEKDNG